MCGIAGHSGPTGKLDTTATVAALRHRGPDDSGVYEAEGPGWSTVVVHTRLAINDLSEAGRQPLFNEDETLALVLNGEIYNSPELRRRCEARGHRFRSHSDAEVVLHLWEDGGIDSLRHLNGIFAFALVDSRTGSLVLARDPLGVKPLFWSHDDDAIWFGSELRAMRAAGAPLGGLDQVAAAQFLTFLWVPDPRTPFRNARSVEPGEVIVWRHGELNRRRYADVVTESAAMADVAQHDVDEEIDDRVRAAVDRQLLSDVPIGIMASGGIDSSLLWWAARDTLKTAFTIDWPSGSGEEGLSDDANAVRRLQRQFETDVHFIDGEGVDVEALPPSGDLFADPAVDLCRLIARHANAQGVKVLLSGQGADELFGGYRRHVVGPLAARLRLGRLGGELARRLTRRGEGSLRTEYLFRAALAASERDALASYMVLCSYSDADDRARALGCSASDVSDEVVWSRHREVFARMPTEWSLLRRFRAVDLSVYLPGLGLAYADRAAMEYSVEVRVPWLDLELVRWGLRLPDRALVRGFRGKMATRRLAQHVLPNEVVNRPKRGFAAPERFLRSSAPSSRGFRQARYLATAEAVLSRWNEEWM